MCHVTKGRYVTITILTIATWKVTFTKVLDASALKEGGHIHEMTSQKQL
jgi:hypothetical protein